MRRLCAVGALTVAAMALLVLTAPVASAARSCAGYTVTTHRTFSGQHYTYRIWIHQISAAGISCGGAHALIHRADSTLRPEPGIYQNVPPWECRGFRPFDGGPHGESMWYSDCKRARGKLSWTETQLSVRRHSRRLLITAELAIIPAAALAGRRYPAIGCDDQTQEGLNRYLWKYKPYGYCYFGNPGTGTSDGIYHTHWSGWGRPRVTGGGYFSDGLGFLHPARMTLYGLSPNNGEPVYRHIRVTWQAIYAPPGVLRPAGSHVYWVDPW